MTESGALLFDKGTWANRDQSEQLWGRVLTAQCPPNDGLQDILVSGELFGVSHNAPTDLPSIAALALANGVYALSTSHLCPGALAPLGEAHVPTNEISSWITAHLDSQKPGKDSFQQLNRAFADLFATEDWLDRTYGLASRTTNPAWTHRLKILLTDCVHIGHASSQQGEALRKRLRLQPDNLTDAQAYLIRRIADASLDHHEAYHLHALVRFVFSFYPQAKLEGAVICDEMSKLLLQVPPILNALDFTLAAFHCGGTLAETNPNLVRKMIANSTQGSLEGSRKLFEWFIEGWHEGASAEAALNGMRRWITDPGGKYLSSDSDEAGICLLKTAWDFVFWAGILDGTDF